MGILLGLFGLGIVVFVHELGHFLAAKAVGVEVEAFSIGWGRPLVGKKIGKTEYRIGIFPIGGYCKMKGEEPFKKALEEKADRIPTEKGSLFSVSPLRRIITYAAGPLANLLFAMIVLSILWYAGFTIHTFNNKVIMLSDYPAFFHKGETPAERAGLQTGDLIVAIGGRPVTNYSELQEAVAPLAGEKTSVTVLREGIEKSMPITPELDKASGIGMIGVSAWIDPVVSDVAPESSASLAGLREGDTITAIDGQPVRHTLDLLNVLETSPGKVTLSFIRDGQDTTTVLIPSYDESGNAHLGLAFSGITVHSPNYSPIGAIKKGSGEAISTFFLTIKGLKSLFSGVRVRDAVSGPVRITYLVGEVAGRGFSEGFATGITTLFRFLSFISIALCFGNLLPIPALDGGLILITAVEFFKGIHVSPRAYYRYQSIGFVIILMILIFATFGDITFLMKE
ncbi:RIP metalloprotease RseP [Sediminispirochaeta smaragdinae]|jgi:regulator of sigma E protease|uniref:Zinc metalloprotease n=1 Tax=Sediminispirochaeta smaragdinae (strain DSM 11293 / JCM 15392 / SEBR 4228) TaxID=573413 RepID=E1R288_SEDSS|nr:RIP metalloprotease RseP [Sediminispirochaeta smaragdinae]ADK81973.1 membrane-associated zinc metalloprotease [Sediminispirochaeta smaragdinae DSM 11293]